MNTKQFILALCAVLVVLFARSSFISSGMVVFSNDCTLGGAASAYNDPLTSSFHVWQDTNYLGMQNPGFQPSGAGMMAALKLIGLALIYTPKTFCVSAVLIVLFLSRFKARIIFAILSLVVSIACFGLILGLACKKVDPSTSAWLAIYPISVFVFPWLMLGTLINLPDSNDAI